MSEVILRANVPLNHLISSPYDTENVSRRKIYGTLEKRIFRVPFIVRNQLFSVYYGVVFYDCTRNGPLAHGLLAAGG